MNKHSPLHCKTTENTPHYIVRQFKKEDEFNNHLERRLKKIEDTLHSKAAMYASKENRLHNFDVAAHISNCTPEQALQGMMMKHIVSVLDLEHKL